MTTTLDTPYGTTALGKLDSEGRLLNAVFKDVLPTEGRVGFRGDIALCFQEQVADEKRPPAYSIEQCLVAADARNGTIPLLAGYLHDFSWLKDAGEVLAEYVVPDGTYVFFASNIDFLKKYRVPLTGDVMAYVLPLDESTVWKETLELLGIDKNDIKKLDGAGKLDAVMNGLAGFSAAYPEISYDEGVAAMEPPRNRNENRPV